MFSAPKLPPTCLILQCHPGKRKLWFLILLEPTGTRAPSPRPPFHNTALLFPRQKMGAFQGMPRLLPSNSEASLEVGGFMRIGYPPRKNDLRKNSVRLLLCNGRASWHNFTWHDTKRRPPRIWNPTPPLHNCCGHLNLFEVHNGKWPRITTCKLGAFIAFVFFPLPLFCRSGALWRQMDLQGIFAKIGDLT